MATSTSELAVARWRLRAGTRLPPQFAAAVGAVLLAAALGVLVARDVRVGAVFLACAPLGLALFGREKFWNNVVLLLFAALMVGGRDISYIHAGPLFITDAVLGAYLLCCAGAVIRGARRHVWPSYLVAALCVLTVFATYRAGLSRAVLQNSAFGFYSLWLVVGLAIGTARRKYIDWVPRLAYWASIPAMVLLCVSSHVPYVPFIAALVPKFVPVAASLYVGFAVLLFVLAPSFVPLRPGLAKFVFLAQLAAIAIGQVRSVWIALPFMLAASLVINRGVPRVHARIVLLPLLAIALLLLVGEFARPGTVAGVSAEAVSIVDFTGGRSTSDANSEWRVSAWTYALGQVEAHPLSGVGLAGDELPVSLCQSACSAGESGTGIHNSVLAMAERMGLPALVLLILTALTIERAGWLGRHDPLTRWLAASSLLVFFTALTAVVLEGPYMGSFFWAFGGMAIARAHISARRLGSVGRPGGRGLGFDSEQPRSRVASGMR